MRNRRGTEMTWMQITTLTQAIPQPLSRFRTRVAVGLLSIAVLPFLLVTPASAEDVVEVVITDALGNIRVITDDKGNVLERHDYLPFGEECTTGPCATNPGVGGGQPRKFTGKERDEETGLDYFGARYYRANTGRFTTVDPVYTWRENLLDPQRWNRYAYARNNPLRYVDPDGRAIDVVADVAFIGYDLFDIGRSVRRGEGVSGTQLLALGGDLVGAIIPLATGVGAAIRAGNKIDDAIDAGRGASNIVDAGRAKGIAKEGRYEFPDQAAGGTPYVGQSGNIPRRLGDHETAGRLKPGTETATTVSGGKTAREIAEHKRIQEITGGVPASKSDKVSNKVDPIGPKRQDLLKE
jgi:RHS repeat-associated protein